MTKCVVCGCTQERGCAAGCGWALDVLVAKSANQPKKKLEAICTVCAPILRPLLRRLTYPIATARKIRRGLEENGLL